MTKNLLFTYILQPHAKTKVLLLFSHTMWIHPTQIKCHWLNIGPKHHLSPTKFDNGFKVLVDTCLKLQKLYVVDVRSDNNFGHVHIISHNFTLKESNLKSPMVQLFFKNYDNDNLKPYHTLSPHDVDMQTLNMSTTL